MVPPEQFHGRFPNIQCVCCGIGQSGLPVIGQQTVIPDTQRNGGAKAVLLPELGPYAFTQRHKGNLYIILADQIPGRGSGVADALHGWDRIVTPNTGVILPIGKLMEHDTVLTQQPVQKIQIGPGQLPNGGNPVLIQFPGGGRPYIEQVAYRKAPGPLPVVFRGDDRGSIRFLHI